MTFPSLFREYLASSMLNEEEAAFAEIDSNGVVVRAGGRTALFGIDDVRTGTPVSDIAPFATGLVAIQGESLVLPRIAVNERTWVDVHLFQTEEGFGLLLQDVSESVAREAGLLQQANELALLKRTSGGMVTDLRELFGALDLLVARRTESGRFVPLGHLPDWGGRFVPILDTPSDPREDDTQLAFLGHFIAEADAFWGGAKPGFVKSGPWIDRDADGTEYLYEATAAYTGEQALLLIVRDDCASTDKRVLIQQGRDLALRERHLQRANTALEDIVRERTESLIEANRRLEEALKKRVELEEERAAIIEHAQETQRIEALGTLAGGIAHDFNNVLAAIFGYAEMGLRQSADDDAVRDIFGSIDEAATRARDLVRQILAMTRTPDAAARDIEVRDVIEEVVRLMRATLPSNIDINLVARRRPSVRANATELHQIAMNLCTNGAHAMRVAGGRLTIVLDEVDVATSGADLASEHRPGRYALIEVTDNGEGIPADILPRIFTPFFTTKTAAEGTGIGLSVVHGIVTAAGGWVVVDSTPGRGSSFRVYWPVAPGPAGGADQPAVDRVDGDERVMVVDDEAMQTEIAREILNQFGYEVVTFTSSRQALAAFTAEPERFDLVISDLAMPEMTGDTLLRAMWDVRKVPAIVLSGNLDASVDKRVEMLGVDRLLRKPVSWRTIARAMRDVLDG